MPKGSIKELHIGHEVRSHAQVLHVLTMSQDHLLERDPN